MKIFDLKKQIASTNGTNITPEDEHPATLPPSPHPFPSFPQDYKERKSNHESLSASPSPSISPNSRPPLQRSSSHYHIRHFNDYLHSDSNLHPSYHPSIIPNYHPQSREIYESHYTERQ